MNRTQCTFLTVKGFKKSWLGLGVLSCEHLLGVQEGGTGSSFATSPHQGPEFDPELAVAFFLCLCGVPPGFLVSFCLPLPRWWIVASYMCVQGALIWAFLPVQGVFLPPRSTPTQARVKVLNGGMDPTFPLSSSEWFMCGFKRCKVFFKFSRGCAVH